MRLLTLFFSLVLAFSSCAATHLNTEDHYADQRGFTIDDEAQIDDTLQNREAIDILLQYRNALIRKDFGSLKKLLSTNYFDNGGSTNTTTDDYDATSTPALFEMLAKHTEGIKYKVTLKSVEVKDNIAFVDYEFEYAYAYKVGGEITWDAGIDVNRLELTSENGDWKIISGL